MKRVNFHTEFNIVLRYLERAKSFRRIFFKIHLNMQRLKTNNFSSKLNNFYPRKISLEKKSYSPTTFLYFTIYCNVIRRNGFLDFSKEHLYIFFQKFFNNSSSYYCDFFGRNL